MPKGEITIEYTLWCGRCAYWWTTGAANKRGAFEIGIRYGWSKVKKDGLVCPGCTHAVKAGHKVSLGCTQDNNHFFSCADRNCNRFL